MNNASRIVGSAVTRKVNGVTRELSSRAYRAANELRNASQFVLRGKRSGKRYTVPGTRKKYRASAPGEAPANRTGTFRQSWGTARVNTERSGKTVSVSSAIESYEKTKNGILLGDLLEAKDRPYKQAVIDRAMPKIREIYGKPYEV